jgi:hypothetical protein
MLRVPLFTAKGDIMEHLSAQLRLSKRKKNARFDDPERRP